MNGFAAGGFAAIFAAGLVGAVANHGTEARGRQELDRFFSRYHLDVRRPLDVEAAAVSPSWDWAAEIAAEVALSDAFDSRSLAGMPSAERQLWLDSAASAGDELRDAERLLLDAVYVRPGWAYHRFLFGRVCYSRMIRDGDPDLTRRPDRWALPLQSALADAPGEGAIADFLAGAYLETWRVVPPEIRIDARGVLRQAFEEPDFVSRGFLTAVSILGRKDADALLPDDPAVLNQAIAAFGTRHDAVSAFELIPRYMAAERRARKDDLQLAEQRRSRDDFAGLVAACAFWTSRHSVEDFDDPGDRRIAARILEIWPADSPGDWQSDPRGRLIAFFLSGIRPEASGAVLERAASPLSGVPDPVRAKILLRAGEIGTAQDLALHSSSRGSFEWTDFLVELAREKLRRGDVAGGAEVVESISAGAEDECDVVLLRRDLALLLHRQPDADVVLALHGIDRLSFGPADWSNGHSLSLCLDPAGNVARTLVSELRLTLPAGTPPPAIAKESSLVEFGWDGGWNDRALLNSPGGSIRSPIGGLSGRSVFRYRVLAGEETVPATSEIVAGP